MALLHFKDAGILGLSAALPSRVIDNIAFGKQMGVENMPEVVDKIGIKERRMAGDDMCASDLCFAAAENLISDMGIDRNDIGLLIFLSQTPDYRMPATSITLQHRLNLPESTIAYDVNLGCSAFVYGLAMAYSMISQPNIKYALVLDGETRTKAYSQKDRKTAFLFGDAGVAALVGRDSKFGDSWFSLNSDGSRQELIKTPAGGYRTPSSVETVTEKVMDEEGNIRSLEHGVMNGPDVFNFVIREVPKDIKRTLEHIGRDLEAFDYYLFHQANSYINGYLLKKLKLDKAKVPMSIHKFGNTSSVSIPLTIVSELKDSLKGEKRLLLSGFGVGLSWATAILNMVDCHICELTEI